MTKHFRFKISLKATLLVSVLLVMAFVVLTPLIIRVAANRAKTSLVDEGKSFASLSTRPIGEVYLLYRDSGKTKLNEQVQKIMEVSTTISNVVITNVGGEVLYAQNATARGLTAAEAGTFNPIYEFDKQGFLTRVISPFSEPTGAHRYTMVYFINSAEVKATLDSLENYMLLAALVVLLVTAILLALFIRLLLVNPLKRMSKLAASISAGDYQQSIQLHRNDEIGDLGQALNTMARQLKADIETLKSAEKLKSEFLIISSHNFRTPLTIITGYLDLLEDIQLNAQARGYLETIATYARQLTDLTNDMLTVAELEGHDKPQLTFEVLELNETLRKFVPSMRQAADKKSQTLTIHYSPNPLLVKAHVTYLQTVLWNLLDNAYKFTPARGIITITNAQEGGNALISVNDTGIGITPEEQAKLFTKFHRGTSVMRYEYEGIGLGLYMTKLMIGFMGGDIRVKSEPAQGSTFTVVLPLSPEASTGTQSLKSPILVGRQGRISPPA